MVKFPSLEKVLKRFDKLTKENIETLLIQAEKERENYSKTLDRLSLGIVMLSEGKSVYMNETALNFFRISESADMNKPLADLVQNKELSDWLTSVVSCAELGFRNKLFFVASKALVVSLETTGSAAQPCLFSFLDITDNLGEVEEVFRGERIESISRLVNAVAHEIKNPLHSLQLHMNILKNHVESLPEEKRESFEKTVSILMDETKRLDQLTNNFMKLGSLKDRYVVESDINKIIEAVIRVIKPELDKAGIEIETVYDERIPKIPIQKGKMHQAFLNLFKNAIEAKSGNDKITIKTSLVDNCSQIEFQDSGVGISRKNLERIFEPYFSTKKEGNGLGLIVVKETVEDHGGKIDVESVEGEGTRFTLFLPVKQVPLKLPENNL